MTAPTLERGAGAVGRDKPILFSAPMVRALIREAREPGTGKTQTRRVLKPQPVLNGRMWTWAKGGWSNGCTPMMLPGHSVHAKMRWHEGDRLWVRETWRSTGDDGRANYLAPSKLQAHPVWYEADGKAPLADLVGKLRPSLFMPRWASRLTLIVTEVRVERLNAISEADARAEGVDTSPVLARLCLGMPEDWHFPTAREAFCKLWGDLHGPDAWAANPWIVAVTFRPILANIDALPVSPGDAPGPSGGAS